MADGNFDSRPVPDPTVLTTEQLHREIGAVREVILNEISHVETRSTERFNAIAERTKEQKEDGRLALDAAFQSAKDAVALQTEASDKAIAKSEAATTKQIDALGVVVEKSTQTTNEKIDDLKTRLDKLEGARVGSQTSTTQLIAWVTVAIALAGVVALVVSLTITR